MLKKKSFRLFAHATSIALEPEFWDELMGMAEEQKVSLTKLIESIDQNHDGNLASTLRVFVLNEVKKKQLTVVE